jgi:hypothetical protein
MSKTPHPTDIEAPAFVTSSLQEAVRHDERGKSELTGGGLFVDNGWDRWAYLVGPGQPGLLTLQLVQAPPLTWWKKIEIYTSFFGNWFWIRTLGVANDTRVATLTLTPAEAQGGTLKLDFWKAGFLNSGSYVTSLVLDVPSQLGTTVQFHCTRDNPGQP